jgi:hypothetical protein
LSNAVAVFWGCGEKPKEDAARIYDRTITDDSDTAVFVFFMLLEDDK